MRSALLFALLRAAAADFFVTSFFSDSACSIPTSLAATPLALGYVCANASQVYVTSTCAPTSGDTSPGFTSARCEVGSTFTPPARSTAQGWAGTGFFTGACPGQALTLATYFPTGVCIAAGSGTSAMYTCSPDGKNFSQSYYYSSTSCSGVRMDSPGMAPACQANSGGVVKFLGCTGTSTPPGTANTVDSTTPPPTCATTTLPSAPSTTPLNCYVGSQDSLASNTSSLFSSNPTAMPYSGPAPPSYFLCVAFTMQCTATSCPTQSGFLPSGTIQRSYAGFDSFATAQAVLAFTPGVSNVLACTTNNCNVPTTDPCALSSASSYTSYACGGKPQLPTAQSLAPPTAPANPATAPSIACFSNANTSTGIPTLQAAAVPGNIGCIAVSIPCSAGSGPAPPGDPCFGKSSSTVVRRYDALQALGAATGSSAALLPFISMILSTLSPQSKANTNLPIYDISVCFTSGCNAPAADACALALAPVIGSVQLSSLPAAALSNGVLTAAARASIEGSLQKALTLTAGCPQCAFKLLSVAPVGGGAPYYTAPSARALKQQSQRSLNAAATGAVVISFSVSGGTPSTLSSMSTASSSPTFRQQLTASLAASNPAFSGVSAAAVAAPPPPAEAASSSNTLAIGLGVGLGALALIGVAVALLRARGGKKPLGSKDTRATMNPSQVQRAGTGV